MEIFEKDYPNFDAIFGGQQWYCTAAYNCYSEIYATKNKKAKQSEDISLFWIKKGDLINSKNVTTFFLYRKI